MWPWWRWRYVWCLIWGLESSSISGLDATAIKRTLNYYHLQTRDHILYHFMLYKMNFYALFVCFIRNEKKRKKDPNWKQYILNRKSWTSSFPLHFASIFFLWYCFVIYLFVFCESENRSWARFCPAFVFFLFIFPWPTAEMFLTAVLWRCLINGAIPERQWRQKWCCWWWQDKVFFLCAEVHRWQVVGKKVKSCPRGRDGKQHLSLADTYRSV